MNNKNKKGFTLTELIVVIVIIAILAAVLIPTLTGTVNKSRKSAASQEAASMNTTYQAWLIDTTENGGYNEDTMSGTTHAEDRLLSFANYYLHAQNESATALVATDKKTSTTPSYTYYELGGVNIITVGDASSNSFVMQATNKYYVKVAKNGETTYSVNTDYATAIAG